MSPTTPSPVIPALTRPRRRLAVVLAVLITLTASCSGDEETAEASSAPGGDVSTPGESSAADDSTPSTTVGPDASTKTGGPEQATPTTSGGGTSSAPDPACRPGEGKTVTELPDVEIPAVHVEAVVVDDQTLAGRTVPGFEIPAIDIPAEVVEGGCTIEYEAPGGCVGRIEVTGLEVPGLEVPGASIPAVEELDFTGDSVDAESVDAESVDGESVGQECQSRDGEGYVPGVYRPGIYRVGIYRVGTYRPALSRPELCVGEECLPAVEIPALEVDAVEVDAAEVDAGELAAKDLPDLPDVPVYGDDDETAYLAPADVLFDFDEAALKPGATRVLAAIVAAAEASGSPAEITVDGHTDNKGDPAYNQRLSEQRAQAVADWLVANGEVDEGLITVRGYGEDAPVAPNETPDGADDPAGRQQNRRVVIAVRTA